MANERRSAKEVFDLLKEYAKEIYKELGAGHAETNYHQALLVCLRADGLEYQHEKEVEVTFRKQFVGFGNADVVIACNDGDLVVELKTKQKLAEGDRTQVRKYMEGLGAPEGVLILFPSEDTPEKEEDVPGSAEDATKPKTSKKPKEPLQTPIVEPIKPRKKHALGKKEKER